MSDYEIAVVEFLSNRTQDWSDIWYLFNAFVAGVVSVSFGVGLNMARAIWMTIALQTFSLAHFYTLCAYYKPFNHVRVEDVVGDQTLNLIDTIAPPPFGAVATLYWFSVVLVQFFIYRRWQRVKK